MTTPYIEGYLPFIQYNGFNTQKAVSLEGTTSISGTTTLSGATTISGALTLSSATPITGLREPVTASGGAARTLTAANSGSMNLFDAATSIAYTLPAPVVGLYYDFLWTALETGGQAHNIVTNTGTVFVTGYITMFSDVNVTPSATLGPKGFAGDGSTHVKVTMNGTTTGGGIGTLLRATCISTTLWNISGVVRSPSGTIATPFST